MTLITCQDLALGYESHAILEHLNFSVNTEDYLCIVGENNYMGRNNLKSECLLYYNSNKRYRTGGRWY